MFEMLAITTASMIIIDQLPLRILITILDYSWNMEDYLAIRQTCKRFKTALSYNSFIPPKAFEGFQECQREFYRQLVKYIPKDGKWDLSHGNVSSLIDLLQRKTRKYEYGDWLLVGDDFELVTQETLVQEHERKQMVQLCYEIFGSHEYCIIGHRRITRIYDDVVFKIANTNFTVLDLTSNHLNNIDNIDNITNIFNVLKRNATSIKLKKLVLHSNNLTDLSCLVDIQDLFDDCYLYLTGNRWRHNQYQGTVTGVARVFVIGQGLNRTKAQRIFRDNKGQPAVICHSDGGGC